MRIVLEITESVNGYRFDLFDSRNDINKQTYKENFETYSSVLLSMTRWIGEEMKKHKAKLEII